MYDDNGNLVAYCGLYCGDCFNYKGEIADLARDLRSKLRKAKFNKVSQGLARYFKDFNDYEQCYSVLGAMVRLRCKKTCSNGGGNPACKIRICCRKKSIAGCWECDEFENCNKFAFLKPIHGDANLKNLVKIKRNGIGGFIKGVRYF
ncbi:MAG: DUF3795 domain-containing protein [Dehalococcoidales bacterium]|nr:DUF3795 domain-containing protein [Dehalococcoidales bacterium]